MKKLLCSIFITFCALGVLSAQKNALYLSYQIDDIGVGIRYDRVLLPGLGIYSSASFGNYMPEGYIKDHVKVATGAVAYSEMGFITLGLSYNHYSDHVVPYVINPQAFEPISFEIGGGTYLRELAIAFRMDVLKGTGVIEIGVNF